MLTIGTIFRALLLFTNSLAVLHEERFLKKGACEATRVSPGEKN